MSGLRTGHQEGRTASQQNCSCGSPREGALAATLVDLWVFWREAMPRAYVVKAGGRAGAVQLVKSGGFNILLFTNDCSSANPKTDPLGPRHRDTESQIRFNSIEFFRLRPHRRLQAKIGIVVNIVAVHLRQDHRITIGFQCPASLLCSRPCHISDRIDDWSKRPSGRNPSRCAIRDWNNSRRSLKCSLRTRRT